MRTFQVITLGVLICLSGYAFAQNPLSLHVAEKLQAYTPVPFSPCTPSPSVHPEHDGIVSDRYYFTVTNEQLASMIAAHYPMIAFSIPVGDEIIHTVLYQADIFAEGFSVQSPSGNIPYNPYTGSVQYRGIIEGDVNSLVALSIFPDHIEGIIANQEKGNLVFAPLDGQVEHVVYYDRMLTVENPIQCATEDPAFIEMPETHTDAEAIALDPCVKVYIEADYEMFQDEGGATQTADYIVSFFNVVSTLYTNESINAVISEIFVWNTSDPYPTSSSFDALDEFLTVRTEFNGDIAHLVTYDDENLGGVAWVDILCYDPLSYAYSNIYSSFNAFPTYSWTVEVFTHEMGHNLGSPHTQNCSWPGGAIDNCYTTEGGCDPGPAPVDGGTIMSYCHLTGYGINFANGFGPLPGDLIRDKVDEAVCLGACDLPPANDWPCSAIEIPVNGNCIFTEATNIGAINSVVPEVTCDGISEGDVWFTCTVGPEEYVIIEMDNGDVISDMGMKLYVGTCTDLSNVPDGCVADGSTYGEDMPGFVVEAPEGTVIFIRVWEVNNDAFGDFSICAYTTCAASIAPDAILADDYIICAGESANLSLDGGSLGSLAQWNWYATSCTGTPLSHDAALTVTPSETTTYYVQAAGECGVTDCIAVTIEVAPLPETPVITIGDCILETPFVADAVYTWFYNGTEIIGETENTLNFTADGDYQVQITTYGDCSAMSTTVEAVCEQLDIANLSDKTITLQPNPAHDHYVIGLSDYTGAFTVTMSTITGQTLIAQQFVSNANGTYTMAVNQPAGVYLIQVEGEGISLEALLVIE